MTTSHDAPQRRHVAEEEKSRPSEINGSAIMTAWLGILLINATVMIAIFLR